LLDKLGAQTLQSGKRVHVESVDEISFRHTIPSSDAVTILRESGIETHDLLRQP